MASTTQGPDPGAVVFCPGMLNEIAASLHSEMQNRFGNCLTEMENRAGHAAFYLCLGREVLRD